MSGRYHRRQRTITFVTAAQSVYLTAVLYIRNNLAAYASACAFGFLFSFIPVVMMIFLVLIRILHASPAILSSLISLNGMFKGIISMKSIISSINSVGRIGSVEIIIGISIFLMARRFFASIMDGMYRIFHRAAPPRPVVSQIIIFGGEVLIVILIAAVIFIIVSAQTLFSLPFIDMLRTSYPGIFGRLTQNLFNTLPYYTAVIFIAVTYRTASGTKPHRWLCLLAAIACIGGFWITVRLMNIFLIKNTYDVIYGVFSRLIIILLEVFTFFIFFLLSAEFIYVIQFFDTLLLGELYLIPGKEKTDLFSVMRRRLFIRPDYLMRSKDSLIRCKAGDVIYWPAETTTEVYYIVHGKVELRRHDSTTEYGRGCFFGELACILKKERGAQASALKDSVLISIDGEKFRRLLEQDSRVAGKALSQISDYFTQIYGRTDGFLV